VRPHGYYKQTLEVDEMQRFQFVVLAAMTAAIVSCDREPTAPARLATLTTDRSVYVAEPVSGTNATLQFTMVTQFTNVSNAEIQLDRTGEDARPIVWYQEIDPDGNPTGDMTGPPCACTGGVSLVVQPGETVTDTFTFAPLPLPGKYRIYIFAAACGGPPTPFVCGSALPVSDRVSAVFEVDPAPQAQPLTDRLRRSRLQLR
jgi:hypothetical protein